jgi:DNA-binding transcriptional regulator YhcF (GntR family)
MVGEAPYRRIAAEIRDRILSGELPPGSRVPSTRAITNRWGVAMATATKVIATLRDEGLVETRPGTGTVVRHRAGVHADPPEPELSRDRVVRAAITVADSAGIGALSMRQVATELGVATMSIYRHVPGKPELMELMADAAFEEMPFPERPPQSWRPTLEFAARLMWRVFRRHPWAAEVLSMSRPQALPHLLDYSEWTLAPLHRLGVDTTTMMHIHLTLFGHIRSIALNLEAEARAEQETGIDLEQWVDAQMPVMTGFLDAERYPTFHHLIQQDFDYDLDALFEFGLHRLLDGFEILLRDYRV